MTTLVAALLLLAFGVTLLLAGISVFRFGRSEELKPSTRFLLVTLRLAIGWHFFIEGLDKLQLAAWSSEGYLREATGPLAPMFRGLAGDRLIAKLTIEADGSLPDELKTEWDAYLDALAAFYDLDATQREKLTAVSDKFRLEAIKWLKTGKREVQMPSSLPPPILLEMTIPERLQVYQNLLDHIRMIELVDMAEYGLRRLPSLASGEVRSGAMRGELRQDLAKQTSEYKKQLRDELLRLGRTEVPADPLPHAVGRPLAAWTMLDWSDLLVKYGITLVGLFLLAGVLTRTSCVVGAGFLIMFFLAMPPLPGWPESPRAEGHYLFINKNIVEALALLVLATTRSGRWAGLDGLIAFLFRRDYAPPPPSGKLDG